MFDLLWLCLELINLHEICTILKHFFYDIRLILLRCDTYGHNNHWVYVAIIVVCLYDILQSGQDLIDRRL